MWDIKRQKKKTNGGESLRVSNMGPLKVKGNVYSPYWSVEYTSVSDWMVTL